MTYEAYEAGRAAGGTGRRGPEDPGELEEEPQQLLLPSQLLANQAEKLLGPVHPQLLPLARETKATVPRGSLETRAAPPQRCFPKPLGLEAPRHGPPRKKCSIALSLWLLALSARQEAPIQLQRQSRLPCTTVWYLISTRHQIPCLQQHVFAKDNLASKMHRPFRG